MTRSRASVCAVMLGLVGCVAPPTATVTGLPEGSLSRCPVQGCGSNTPKLWDSWLVFVHLQGDEDPVSKLRLVPATFDAPLCPGAHRLGVVAGALVGVNVATGNVDCE